MAVSSYTKAIIIVCLIIVLCTIHGGYALPLLDSCGKLASSPKQSKYSKMLSDAKAIEDEIIAIRRELHRKPAIMYEEYAAQELVIEKLTELGLRYLLLFINYYFAPSAFHYQSHVPASTIRLSHIHNICHFISLHFYEYSTRKMAITGVVSDLGADVNATTNTEKPTVVVLRADMDALPIHEETDLAYKSEVDGVMHACTNMIDTYT